METLTIMRDMSLFNMWTVSVPNLDFFFTGITNLVRWNYSFFGGNAAIFLYAMYSLTFAVAFMLFTIMIGLFFQYFRSR